MLRRNHVAISPTAHYTGHVWSRNGLSHPGLATREGRLLYGLLEPPMMLNRALGSSTIEDMLMARHRAIDGLLVQAIEDGGISQVIEVACGMSPRGWSMTERFGDRLTYIEADLPAMAARKRAALDRIGALSDTHSVVDFDALATAGPTSLAEVAAPLDRDRGLLIITEGLLGYLPLSQVQDIWSRFAATLGEFANNRYLSDLNVESDVGDARARAFRVMLSAFVRGRVHVHFPDARAAESALLGAGFASAAVLPAGDLVADTGLGGRRVQVVHATAAAVANPA